MPNSLDNLVVKRIEVKPIEISQEFHSCTVCQKDFDTPWKAKTHIVMTHLDPPGQARFQNENYWNFKDEMQARSWIRYRLGDQYANVHWAGPGWYTEISGGEASIEDGDLVAGYYQVAEIAIKTKTEISKLQDRVDFIEQLSHGAL